MPDRKAFLLRLKPEVYDALRRWADDDLRSVNAQIEYLLRRALREEGRDAAVPKSEDPKPRKKKKRKRKKE